MNNFTHSIPTKVYFGKGQITHLSEIKASGSKVLLVYGGSSIKKNGLYNRVHNILRMAGLRIYELPGIEPNPRIESVREGVKICKDNHVDMVLAVGGGSVIDAAKVIAGGALYGGDPWSLVIHPIYILKALPVYTVLTLAATGSEMNGNAVISDLGKHEKWGTASPFFKPVMSICDPEYTYSVPAKQTAAGTADIMSHTFENYFTNVEGSFLQARFCESILKTCIKYGPIALAEPNNYEARANLMWASSNAINGMLNEGAEVAWCVHPIEHELSAFYDITHGEGLAIITPSWMEFALNENTAAKFAEYGRNVWDIEGEDDMEVAKAAIARTREFFVNELHIPGTLREVGIEDEKNFEEMAAKAAAGCKGSFVPLEKDDIVGIFRAALGTEE